MRKKADIFKTPMSGVLESGSSKNQFLEKRIKASI
jgi:hypothetical protein